MGVFFLLLRDYTCLLASFLSSELGLGETLSWEEIGQQDLVGLPGSRQGRPAFWVCGSHHGQHALQLQYALGKDVFHQMWRKGSGAFD